MLSSFPSPGRAALCVTLQDRRMLLSWVNFEPPVLSQAWLKFMCSKLYVLGGILHGYMLIVVWVRILCISNCTYSFVYGFDDSALHLARGGLLLVS